MHKTELYKGRIGTDTYIGTVADGSSVVDVVREVKRAGRTARYERVTYGNRGTTHHVVVR